MSKTQNAANKTQRTRRKAGFEIYRPLAIPADFCYNTVEDIVFKIADLMKKHLLPGATVIALFVTAAIFYFLFPQPDDTPTTAPKPGELVHEGTKTLVGTLSPEKYRKGGPTLTTEKTIIFLDNDFFDTPAGQEALKLDGKRVEIRGDVTTRYCGGEYIQCLSQGFISNMDKIQYIKLAK